MIYVAGWESHTTCLTCGIFPGLDLYNTDPAQHIITAGQDPDDLDRYLSDLSDVCKLLHKNSDGCRTIIEFDTIPTNEKITRYARFFDVRHNVSEHRPAYNTPETGIQVSAFNTMYQNFDMYKYR